MILAYRPEGATEFLGREMKEVADGRYGAEIPTSATSGGTVAYYIEAEDADGAPIAARGSVDNPLVIHLLGVGVSHRTGDEDEDEDEDDDDEGPDHRYFVGLMAGIGLRLGDRHRRHQRRRHDRSVGPGDRRAGPDRARVRLLAELVADAVAADPLRVHHRHDRHLRDDADQCPKRLPHGELRARGVRQGDLEVRRREQVPSVLLAGGGRRPHPPRRQLQQNADAPRTAGRTTTRPASTRSAPGRCCSVRAAASCTTSPRARRSWCRRTRCSRSPISPSTSTATSASPSRSSSR